MRRISIFCSLLLIVLLAGCTTEKKDTLAGTWELVSGQYTFPDTSMTLAANANLKAFKIFSSTHYANLAQDTTQQFFVARGGTYRLEGDEYTEYVVIDQSTQGIGGSATFKYKIDGNQFKISDKHLSEVWQKVE
jgi:hypothetical protein